MARSRVVAVAQGGQGDRGDAEQRRQLGDAGGLVGVAAEAVAEDERLLAGARPSAAARAPAACRSAPRRRRRVALAAVVAASKVPLQKVKSVFVWQLGAVFHS
ncbi:MAG: hypothetical protein U1F43_25770 [Myxococcota bacterium]